MAVDVRVPEVGESVQEALLAEWFKADGDRVGKDEELFLIETDKVTLEVTAERAGVLEVLVEAGTTVQVGDVVGRIRENGAGDGDDAQAEDRQAKRSAAGGQASRADAAEEQAGTNGEQGEDRTPQQGSAPEQKPKAGSAAGDDGEPTPASGEDDERPRSAEADGPVYGPAVRRLLREHELAPEDIPATGPGGRLTQGDVRNYLDRQGPARPAAAAGGDGEGGEETRGRGTTDAGGDEPEARPGERRKPLSPIRKRIGERLLRAVHDTAMLTTFNEIDMGEVQTLRRRFKDSFKDKHGFSLGITSFFVQGAVEALEEFPELNAFIEGDTVVYHDAVHMGVAVGSERGLVVPVLRDAQGLGIVGIERELAAKMEKIRAHRLEVADLEGGTFTITNGGVFGSLMSTPILNPPQSGILGLHKIEPRPVVVDGEVVVRPMMYVALTYDHRMVDGRDAVRFLVRVKELIEDPERLLLEV